MHSWIRATSVLGILWVCTVIGSAVQDGPVFSQAHLDHVALEQGYGYKFANMQELEKLVVQANARNSKKSYIIAVPAFAGVTSCGIQKILKTHAGFDLQQKWATIINRYFSTQQSQTVTLSKKSFLEGDMRVLRSLSMPFFSLQRKM